MMIPITVRYKGKQKISNQPQDGAFQFASDTDSSGSDTGRTMRLESSVKQKNMELSRRIEQSPSDINAWLSLIEHQDALLRAGDDRRRITNAEIRSTADIKIHMYEKALDKIHCLQDRFTELAVAIWQGILEMNFQGPESIHTIHETPPPLTESGTLQLFGEFWEAEVPRIGETNSLGWKNFAETGDDSKVPEPQADEPETSLGRQNLFRSWVVAESSRIKASRVPARTMDDTVEDDPYRLSIYEDLSLNAFLIFCHLPFMPNQDQESSIDWSYDSCLHNEILDYDSEWIKEEYFTKPAEDAIEGEEPKVSLVFATPTRNFAMGPESMFSTNWFSSFKPWKEIYGSEDNGPVSYFWVRNTLKQLANTYPIDDLAEYYLAFEWTNEPSTIKKVARALIKQHSSSLKLYNAYAMIEWSKGNQEISNGIYAAALGMTPQSPQQGNITSALEILTTFSAQLSSRITINSKSTYPQTLLHQSTARLLHHHAKSGPYRPQTLHEYLTKSLRLFPSNTIFFCLLTSPGLGMTRLLSPIAMNTLFGELLDSSSNHHNLLPLYLHILHHHLQHPQSPTPNLNTINSTFISALSLRNKDHKSTSDLSSSPSLWKLYLLFLNTYPQFLPTTSSSLTSQTLLLASNNRQHVRETNTPKARGMVEVWKQAIAKVPWCKGIYMVGFEMLTKDGGSGSDAGDDRANEHERGEQRNEEIERQLKHIWRVMGEKEIRLHVDLEGAWDAED
ncbi:hypothetical protein EYC84_007417 [Monilinia fructicola]|uniref:Uncharacterized protein n=1 Tax=Monilinia fructicola TaxID=38448 RepID=A0A5M9JGI5_MONFR|nr:hypothetical protein EYC84_007417 [Monilinia fructicola]